MKLLHFGTKIETEPSAGYPARRDWRWAVEAGRWFLELGEQVRFPEAENTWGRAYRYVRVDVFRPWRFTFLHLYYDGPHHSLWIGPVQISWTPRNMCSECM